MNRSKSGAVILSLTFSFPSPNFDAPDAVCDLRRRSLGLNLPTNYRLSIAKNRPVPSSSHANFVDPRRASLLMVKLRSAAVTLPTGRRRPGPRLHSISPIIGFIRAHCFDSRPTDSRRRICGRCVTHLAFYLLAHVARGGHSLSLGRTKPILPLAICVSGPATATSAWVLAARCRVHTAMRRPRCAPGAQIWREIRLHLAGATRPARIAARPSPTHRSIIVTPQATCPRAAKHPLFAHAPAAPAPRANHAGPGWFALL
ncbi:hypothetical protein DFH07DRAFT_962507 [Mycena maculata]|uniref:Uncharacterized protein n=1 Tax=Mycena maculata TaxID=230809 RepID=A0AAD7IRM4_9AGAR|nr:hypothetical protein DFH07DRAFT_962507 [Mycena maculata]